MYQPKLCVMVHVEIKSALKKPKTLSVWVKVGQKDPE